MTLQTSEYKSFLNDLKLRIRTSQVKAALAINKELVLLYWSIGQDILTKQEELGWGAKVIDQLSDDLREEFPEIKGFSKRNLKYMRSFADAYPEEEFVQQAAAQIPWFHNCTILEKIKNHKQRQWYIEKTIENGWSRNVLSLQIKSNLYERDKDPQTNFINTLPTPQSDLANQLIKNEYSLDFLSLGKESKEREIENALVTNIRDFILELGKGFAFYGNQVHLDVGGEDFYLDLVFYHVKLRCYVVIELKTGKFKPEYAGKMNFYLAAVDDLMRHPDDKPSIGIILCQDKNQIIAEYSLRNTSTPIGISAYELTRELSAELQKNLPSVEQIELELANDLDNVEEN